MGLLNFFKNPSNGRDNKRPEHQGTELPVMIEIRNIFQNFQAVNRPIPYYQMSSKQQMTHKAKLKLEMIK